MTTTQSEVHTAAETDAPSVARTLDIGGMTCASCVRRVEKVLTKLDGVSQAEVNLATEAASVVYDPARVALEQLKAAIASAGYTGQLRTDDVPGSHTPSSATTAADQHDEHDRVRDASCQVSSASGRWR